MCMVKSFGASWYKGRRRHRILCVSRRIPIHVFRTVGSNYSWSMKTIALEIPESLLWQTGESTEQLKARAQFLLALKLFELGQVTSGQAAELSRMSRVEFLFKAGEHGVPVADLDQAEIEKEIARA